MKNLFSNYKEELNSILMNKLNSSCVRDSQKMRKINKDASYIK